MNLQYVKHTISAKPNKAKCNKTRCAWLTLYPTTHPPLPKPHTRSHTCIPHILLEATHGPCTTHTTSHMPHQSTCCVSLSLSTSHPHTTHTAHLCFDTLHTMTPIHVPPTRHPHIAQHTSHPMCTLHTPPACALPPDSCLPLHASYHTPFSVPCSIRTHPTCLLIRARAES